MILTGKFLFFVKYAFICQKSNKNMFFCNIMCLWIKVTWVLTNINHIIHRNHTFRLTTCIYVICCLIKFVPCYWKTIIIRSIVVVLLIKRHFHVNCCVLTENVKQWMCFHPTKTSKWDHLKTRHWHVNKI